MTEMDEFLAGLRQLNAALEVTIKNLEQANSLLRQRSGYKPICPECGLERPWDERVLAGMKCSRCMSGAPVSWKGE